MRIGELTRHVAYILALVGVGRIVDDDAMLIQITDPGGNGQNVHLTAGIVDVILTRHIPTGKRQQIGQARTIGRTTAVTDMERAGRIGRYEFDQHLGVLAQRTTTEMISLRQNGADDPGLGAGIEFEIDKTCTGDRNLADLGGKRQFVNNTLGNDTRRQLQGARQLHGQIGGEIPMFGLFRTLQVDRGFGVFRGDAGKRGLQQAGDVFAAIKSHG